MKNLLLALIIFPCFTHATTYYVSPSGNDGNPGTITSPFRNWQRLSNIMVAGDIAYIRGGTYTPTSPPGLYIHCLISNLNGNSGNWITIQNYPGESPVFDFTGFVITNTDAWAVYFENCSYLKVKGLRITGLAQSLGGVGVSRGINIALSNNMLLEQIEVDHMGGTGFFVAHSDDVTYLNCDSHHNADPYSTTSPPYGGADGFSGSGGETSTRTVYNGCRAWWNSDDGFDFFATDGVRTLINCWSFWNGYIAGTFNTAGNGEGYKLGPTATNQSTVITKFLNNCLAFKNRAHGFSQNAGQSRYQVYNCTSYDNEIHGYWWGSYAGITQDFKNNIAYNNGGSAMADLGQAQGSYNSWNGAVTVNNTDFLSVSSTGVDGSRQSNGSLPDLNFLKLAQGSDLIDAGVNVNLPYNGSAPDIGAYEFVTSSSIPPPIVGTITHPTCTIATGSVILNGLPATGSWTLTRTPGNVTTTGTGTSITITGLLPGTYSYTVSNASSTSAASANVVINPQPATPSAPTVGTITHPTCAVATGSVVLSGLPAAGTWTLIRTPGGTTTTGTGTSRTITGLAPGTYTYTVTNASGCISAASANVVINTQPAAPATPTVGTITHPTCAVATGSVVLSGLPAAGTWTLTRTPGNVTTTGTGTTTTITGLAPGTYTYTVTNAAGCISAASANVVINTQPATPATPTVGTITHPTCAVATGSVILSGLPASGTWTLTRTPGGVTTTGTGTTTTITGLAPGTYTYTVTIASGCISAASANVVVNAQPATPATPTVGTITHPTCAVATGSVILSGLPASGTWTLTRTPGGVTTTGTGTTTTITGLAPGTYTYTVTNAAGCISAVSANVVVNAQPATPATPTVGTITHPTCAVATGSVILSGLPASGTWTLTRTPGNVTTTGTGTTTTITGLAPGTYTYTVTNASGCISAASANVVINTQPATPATPTVGTITHPTCAVATGSVILSGLPASGTWTLTRTPGNVTTTGTGTTTTITGLAPGTYTYTVTNASGCISAASANVVINAQPATPATPTVGTITHPTCAVATGSVILSGLPTSGTWTLTRTPGGVTTTGTGTTTTITGLAPGTYTYTVTNASGCISAASANVVVNAQPATPSTPTVGTITHPTCAVATGSVVLSGLPAAGTWTLTRTPGNVTTTGTGTTTTITGLAPGTYTYTVTNAAGCISAASANVVINTQPATPATPTVGTITHPTCAVATGSVILSGLPAAGTWTLTRTPGGVTTTGTGTSRTITGLAPGTYTYTVTNASGCISAASANVVINTQPATPATPTVGTITHPTCAVATGSVILSGLPASGTWTLTRTPGNITTTGTGTITTITGLAPGTYTYTVTNASGCISAASANVVINTQPATPSVPTIVSITQSTGTVVLSDLPASGTWTLTMAPGGTTTTGTGTSTTITGLTPGTYTYTVTNASGCTSAASANVFINAAPTANAGPDKPVILPTNSTSLTGSGSDADGTIIGYDWKQLSGPSANVLFSLNTAVTYANNLIEGSYEFELMVTDNMGATSRDTVKVIVTSIQSPNPVAFSNSIRVYPNPVVNTTTLEINKAVGNSKVLEVITDAQGKTILVKELSSLQNTILEKIDMSNLSKGIYLVTIFFNEDEKQTLKVLKN